MVGWDARQSTRRWPSPNLGIWTVTFLFWVCFRSQCVYNCPVVSVRFHSAFFIYLFSSVILIICVYWSYICGILTFPHTTFLLCLLYSGIITVIAYSFDILLLTGKCHYLPSRPTFVFRYDVISYSISTPFQYDLFIYLMPFFSKFHIIIMVLCVLLLPEHRLLHPNHQFLCLSLTLIITIEKKCFFILLNQSFYWLLVQISHYKIDLSYCLIVSLWLFTVLLS